MSRSAHLFVGLAILALCAVWCFVCFVWFIGNAVGRDSVPGASIHDSSFMAIYLFGGAGLICGLWFAVRSFGRALRSPRLDLPSHAAPQPVTPEEQQRDMRTPDDRLAHLVKKKEI
jgi:hypothetical protein